MKVLKTLDSIKNLLKCMRKWNNYTAWFLWCALGVILNYLTNLSNIDDAESISMILILLSSIPQAHTIVRLIGYMTPLWIIISFTLLFLDKKICFEYYCVRIERKSLFIFARWIYLFIFLFSFCFIEISIQVLIMIFRTSLQVSFSDIVSVFLLRVIPRYTMILITVLLYLIIQNPILVFLLDSLVILFSISFPAFTLFMPFTSLNTYRMTTNNFIINFILLTILIGIIHIQYKYFDVPRGVEKDEG